MSPESLAALLLSLGTNVVVIVRMLRMSRVDVASAQVKVDEAQSELKDAAFDNAVERWSAYASRLEGKLDALEKEMREMRKNEIACAEKSARQEVQIQHLTDAVRTLKQDLRRAGIKPSTVIHDLLPPTEPEHDGVEEAR